MGGWPRGKKTTHTQQGGKGNARTRSQGAGTRGTGERQQHQQEEDIITENHQTTKTPATKRGAKLDSVAAVAPRFWCRIVHPPHFWLLLRSRLPCLAPTCPCPGHLGVTAWRRPRRCPCTTSQATCPSPWAQRINARLLPLAPAGGVSRDRRLSRRCPVEGLTPWRRRWTQQRHKGRPGAPAARLAPGPHAYVYDKGDGGPGRPRVLRLPVVWWWWAYGWHGGGKCGHACDNRPMRRPGRGVACGTSRNRPSPHTPASPLVVGALRFGWPLAACRRLLPFAEIPHDHHPAHVVCLGLCLFPQRHTRQGKPKEQR